MFGGAVETENDPELVAVAVSSQDRDPSGGRTGRDARHDRRRGVLSERSLGAVESDRGRRAEAISGDRDRRRDRPLLRGER
jgi:hypothetical protein